MARNHFYSVNDVAIEEILLDTLNPRIRHGDDQNDCIARILMDRENFTNLLKDIAEHGLTPEHILLSKNADGKWVVRDGNRRITALKILNRPAIIAAESQEEKAFLSLVLRVKNEHKSNIPQKVNCLACDDEQQILAYLDRKHTGQNQGVGQVMWSALLKSLFNLQTGENDPNKRAAQLVLWGEEHGLHIPDNYPITNLVRGLNTETLALIGFKIVDDKLVPLLPVQQAYALAAKVINDIGAGRVHVKRDGSEGSILTTEEQRAYFTKVREEIGPPLSPTATGSVTPQSDGNCLSDEAQQGSTYNKYDKPGSGAQQYGGSSETTGPTDRSQPASIEQDRKPPSPNRPPWDRPCLFGSRKNSSPGITFPDSEVKLKTIIVELRRLNPNDTPMATAMLLRALIELSNAHYREKNGLPERSPMHKSIKSSADHMKTNGLISDQQIDVISRYTSDEKGIFHFHTIQAYLHKSTFHPNGQTMNTFWDEIGFFVRSCWA